MTNDDSEFHSAPGAAHSAVPGAPRTPDLILVNLGCGSVFHPAWINVDFDSRDPAVRAVDLRGRLPFSDGSVDAVYHAHLLEHLDRADAERFLAENVRVLRPDGVLRVVVPDLEGLCRAYLEALDAAERGEAGASALYEWSLLDLLDQMVRRRSGGRMPEFLGNIDLAANPRVAARLTLSLREQVTGGRSVRSGPQPERRRRGWQALSRRAERGVARFRREAAGLLARVVAGPVMAASFAEGAFRATGEVHRWMYDRYSLRQALTAAGLVDIIFRGPTDSAIPDFAAYELDQVDGRVRRPGSLFAEGRRPSA